MNAHDELLKKKREQLKQLKKEHTEAKKGSNHDLQAEIQRQINENARYLSRFKKSNMEPRAIGSIVINYRLYERFMKKLKGFQVTEQVSDEKLIVKYRKGSNNGTLELMDISKHFEGGSEFPKGDMYYGVQVESG